MLKYFKEMTKISIEDVKKQIKTGVFYIDSAKFLCDADVFKSINIPKNRITVDVDTGETLSEFKKNSLVVNYKNFEIFIGQYTKVLPNKIYNKLALGFSSKISEHYLTGMKKTDFEEVLCYLRSIARVDFQDADLPKIINAFFTKDTDIAYNIIVPNTSIKEVINQWKELKKTSPTPGVIKIGNKVDNQMIQFGKRGDAFFFKIYNKTLEARSDAEELNKLPLTDFERYFFLELSNNFSMFRVEITIKNKKDFERLNTSSKIVDLWSILDNNPKDVANLVRRYFDEMTGTYKPRKREMQKISATKRLILSSIVTLSKQGMSFTEIEKQLLSLFGDDVHRKDKHRAKKLTRDLYNHYFSCVLGLETHKITSFKQKRS